MRPFASDRLLTVWQWLITGLVVVVLHALILRNLQLPGSASTSKVVNRIEVELSAPRALPVVAPLARMTAKPKPVVERAPPSPARRQRHADPEPAEREPVTVAAPTAPVPSNEADEVVPTAASTPASHSLPSERPAGPPENEPLAPPRFNAAYLNNPTPPYPAAARRAGYEGAVIIRAHVQIDGSADRVEIKKSSGYAILDQAALEAVRKWRFVPAKRGNDNVAEWVEIPWTFKLEDE